MFHTRLNAIHHEYKADKDPAACDTFAYIVGDNNIAQIHISIQIGNLFILCPLIIFNALLLHSCVYIIRASQFLNNESPQETSLCLKF